MKISEALIKKYSTVAVTWTAIWKQPTDPKDSVRTCAVTDYKNLNQQQTYEMYSSIGHDETEKPLLWMLQGGKLLQEYATPDTPYHHTIWPPESLKYNYRGRVLKDTDGGNLVTVFRPEKTDPDTESKVMRMVMMNFNPKDVKVFG